MKKSNYKLYDSTMLNTMTVFLTILTLSFSSCKQGTDQDSKPVSSNKTTASTSAPQELPGGKKYFSNCIGRFAATGAAWVRMVNWTFNPDGTVAGYFWQWDSTQEKGKTAFNSHSDTWAGSTATCTMYTPTGWVFPSGQYYSISGNYTYNPITGALHIDWTGLGTGENWKVTNPISTIARVSFVSSTGSGYGVTHGAGYGSNRAQGTTAGYHFKKVQDIPKVLYSGKRVVYNLDATKAGTANDTIWIPENAKTGAWDPYSLNLSNATLSSGGTSLHYYTTTGSGPCMGNTRTGNITHVASNNNSRAMVYNHWLACLGVGNGTWPCYNGQMHPYAIYQVIDDNGAMKGFIGIEQQDQPGSTCCFEYQLIDYTVIP